MDSICSWQPHFKPNKERMIRMTKFKKALITTAALATAALCSLTAYAAVRIIWVDDQDSEGTLLISSNGLATSSIKGENVSHVTGEMASFYTHTTGGNANTQVLVLNAVNKAGETRYMSGYATACDSEGQIIWSTYQASSGNVSKNTPLLASTNFSNSSLEQGNYFLRYYSSIFYSNNSNSPVKYNTTLNVPYTVN